MIVCAATVSEILKIIWKFIPRSSSPQMAQKWTGPGLFVSAMSVQICAIETIVCAAGDHDMLHGQISAFKSGRGFQQLQRSTL